MTARWIAQRALTGAFIDWDVPLRGRQEPRRDLSGPGSITASVAPEYLTQTSAADGRPILEEWSTALYREIDGQITWGGLVVGVSAEGGELAVEAAGFAAYLSGYVFEGSIAYALPIKIVIEGLGTLDSVTPRGDAYDAVRLIWEWVQSQPDSNLGVQVDTHASGYLLGSDDGTDPYRLSWWDAPDCGDEIDSLAREALFDWREEHAWNAARDGIDHFIRLGRRRLGRRRDDLRFAQGENLAGGLAPTGVGDDFANSVICLGSGEEKQRLRASAAIRDGRLRRPKVVADKSISNKVRLQTLARTELQKAGWGVEVDAIIVTDHENAPIGSWQLGDDILVKGHIPWFGEFAVWHRVIADELGETSATLHLVRSERFA